MQQLRRGLEFLVLEQAPHQRVSRIFLFARIAGRGLWPRQQHLALDVNQRRRHHQEFAGDVEVKTKLAVAINTVLDPIRERRAQALAKPGYLREVLMEGSQKARVVAQATMERVRDAVKLKY